MDPTAITRDDTKEPVYIARLALQKENNVTIAI